MFIHIHPTMIGSDSDMVRGISHASLPVFEFSPHGAALVGKTETQKAKVLQRLANPNAASSVCNAHTHMDAGIKGLWRGLAHKPCPCSPVEEGAFVACGSAGKLSTEEQKG